MKVFLYLPAARTSPNLLGGQVTAARGLIRYLESSNVEFSLVDTAINRSGSRVFSNLLNKIHTLYRSVNLSFTQSFDSAIFFKSTSIGLFERFLPAFLLRLKGCKTSLFFRNSNIIQTNSAFSIFLLKFFLFPYRVYFVQGESVRNKLIALGFESSKVHVIPNWLPPGFEIHQKLHVEYIKRKGTLRFVFTGRVIRVKGVFEILSALKTESLFKKCSFCFVGDGPDLSSCKSFVDLNNIENVHFTGALSHTEVSSVLRDSDVLVLPTYHPEGFPNSILEAMALGLPVITTNAGEITDSVQHGINGLIVDKMSTDSLYDALLKYIIDPELVSLHSKAAIEVVHDRHNWGKNCQKLLDLLN